MQLEAPGLRLYLGLSLDPSLPRPGWRLSIKISHGNLDPEFRNWEAGTGKGVRVMSSTLLWDLQVATGWVAHLPHPTPPLLAVHGRDGFHSQWEGFAVSHKAAYRA